MPIRSVYARQILDSRGFPTVEVDLITELGLFRANVSAGISVGQNQALELRDNIKTSYHGQSVTKAIENINNTIGPELIKQKFEVTQQTEIDQFMICLDGTDNKSMLGANAILAVSLAVAKAGAAKKGIPLYRHIADLANNTDLIIPVPAFNVLNGGTPSGNNIGTQEFMILPTGASTFAEAMKIGSEVYHYLRLELAKKYGPMTVNEEGGFAPKIPNEKAALTFINKAIKKAGYTGRVEIAIDTAASEFYKAGKYNIEFKNKKKAKDKKFWIDGAKLNKTYLDFLKKFPIVSIEDPFHFDDWKSWTAFTELTEIQIVGDELTVSNYNRIEEAIEKSACNCVLIRLTQAGTVTDCIQAHQVARKNTWGTMISNRTGETEDSFIADMCVGLSAGQIKAGAPCRSECMCKYNQILRIEEELGNKAKYAGKAFRRPNF